MAITPAESKARQRAANPHLCKDCINRKRAHGTTRCDECHEAEIQRQRRRRGTPEPD